MPGAYKGYMALGADIPSNRVSSMYVMLLHICCTCIPKSCWLPAASLLLWPAQWMNAPSVCKARQGEHPGS